nr:omega-amidase NIT2-like [Dermacentor andersoni]
MTTLGSFRVAVIQLAVRANKVENLARATEHVKKAAARGAKLVCLPEFFGFPCAIQNFHKNAEPIPGRTSEFLADTANSNGVYLVGGTMAERDGDLLYNTCLVYGPDGELIAKHRKLHLFDVDIPGKMTVKESDCFAAGDSPTTFDTPYCKVGLGICYDLRFAELASLYAKQGCKLLLFPGAFNMATGPLHWKMLQRARAVDNQVYVASASAATDERACYVAWGHSMLVDPMGNVVTSAGAVEELVVGDVDLDLLASVRNQIPIAKQKRDDIY